MTVSTEAMTTAVRASSDKYPDSPICLEAEVTRVKKGALAGEVAIAVRLKDHDSRRITLSVESAREFAATLLDMVSE